MENKNKKVCLQAVMKIVSEIDFSKVDKIYEQEEEIAKEILNTFNEKGYTISSAIYILDFCKEALKYCSVNEFI